MLTLVKSGYFKVSLVNQGVVAKWVAGGILGGLVDWRLCMVWPSGS
jgi:hypothetical protein